MKATRKVTAAQAAPIDETKVGASLARSIQQLEKYERRLVRVFGAWDKARRSVGRYEKQLDKAAAVRAAALPPRKVKFKASVMPGKVNPGNLLTEMMGLK